MRKFHLIARSVVVTVPILFIALAGWGQSDGLGALLLLAGILGGGGAFAWRLIGGRNEVYGSGGAADASSLSRADPNAPTSMVTDLALPKMATIQFDPPPGIAPWEGMVLLSERYDKDKVLEAYFSGLAGAGVIEIQQDENTASCAPGPHYDSADADDRARVGALFSIANPFVFGTRDWRIRPLIDSLHIALQAQLRDRGYWRHGTPTASAGGFGKAVMAGVRVIAIGWALLLLIALLDSLGVLGFFGFLESVPALTLLTFALTFWLGWRMFRVLSPSRSAIGSALTLHTESFRRFLHDSESEQVQQALERGVLREYAGWAVALDETEAWSESISELDIPMIDFAFLARDTWSFFRDPDAYHANFVRQHAGIDVSSLTSLVDGLAAGQGLSVGADLAPGDDLGDGENFVREEILRDASGQEIGRRTIRFSTRRTRRD